MFFFFLRLGITSLLSSPSAIISSDSCTTGKISSSSSSTSASVVPSQSLSLSSAPVPSSYSSALLQSTSSQALQTSNPASALVQALHRDMDLTTEPEPSLSSKSLESKIHSFLQGNPAFSSFDLGFSTNPVLGGDSFSPVTGTDTQDGTPVRDEGGGTPTQDEIKPVVVPFTSNTNQLSVGETAKTAQQSSTQQNPSQPPQQTLLRPGVAQNGQLYQSHPYGIQEMSDGISAPVAHYQQISPQIGGPVPGERAPGIAMSERSWYNDTYPEGNSQHPRGYVTVPGGAGENLASGLYPCQTEQTQEPQDLASQQVTTTSSTFFRSNLPPVPHLPPPPHVFEAPPAATSGIMIPPEQQPIPCANTAEMTGARGDSVISGMVVHDHQHKSMFHPDESLYEFDRPCPRPPEDLHPHPEDLRYQEEREHYHDELRRHDALFFQDDPYHHPDERYRRAGSPPHHYPRGRGHLTPPLSPSEDPYYTHTHQQYSPPPPHYAPRRPPPPPHLEIRHPGLRPPHRLPHRPPHPGHHPHPRGPPRAPFPHFHGPDPRLRGKRPGPRGPMFPPKRPFPPPRY